MRSRSHQTRLPTQCLSHRLRGRSYAESDAAGSCRDGEGPLHWARVQGLASDHQALDLRGSLVELHDLRVAHQLLDRVVLDEAVPAVDLNRVGRDLHRRIGGEALGMRGLEGVALAL